MPVRSCCFANLGHVHTNPDICETAYFFIRIRVDGALGPVYKGGGRPQIGEVTCGRSPHLSCKRDQIKMRDGQASYPT